MISFRFHVVSIVAVFLALAIGIVVGSTVIDRAIVEGLRNRVDEVSDNLDERQAANDALSEQVDQLEAWATEVGPIAVDGRLAGTVTVVVTDRGVDRDPIDRTIDLLAQADSTVRGVLTLEASWAMEDAEARAELAPVLDLDPDAAVAAMQERAAELLVADLSSSVEVVDDGTGALDRLADRGLVDYEARADVVAPRPRRILFVLVTGTGSELAGLDHLAPFAATAAGSAGSVVATEVFVEQEDGPERGDALAVVRDDPTLAEQVATVDDLDLAPGPATTVLALVDAQAGIIGHYGVGAGADLAAPPAPDSP